MIADSESGLTPCLAEMYRPKINLAAEIAKHKTGNTVADDLIT